MIRTIGSGMAAAVLALGLAAAAPAQDAGGTMGGASPPGASSQTNMPARTTGEEGIGRTGEVVGNGGVSGSRSVRETAEGPYEGTAGKDNESHKGGSWLWGLVPVAALFAAAWWVWRRHGGLSGRERGAA